MDPQPRALILHRMSLNKDPHRQIWYSSCKEQLEKEGYTVDIPVMPERFFGEETLENLASRYRYLVNSFSIRAGVDLVIGHSIGGALALYMAQYIPIKHIILTAPYIPPGLHYETIAAITGYIDLIYQEKDPSIPMIMTNALIENLTKTNSKLKTHQKDSKDHLNSLNVNDLLGCIQNRKKQISS